FLILYCFFLCLIRRLTGSALFPYTTLFRSLAGVFTCIYFVARRGIGAWYFQKKTPEAMQAAIFWDPQNAQYYDALATLRHFYAEDRKSTRLNSSHSQISYAVFCLKKKKNNK